MAIEPTGTGAPSETLDRSELQEEVGLQAPALVVTHAIVVEHRSQRVGSLIEEVPVVGQDVLILIVAAIGIVGGQQRGHSQQRADAVAIDTTYADTTLVGSREGDVLTNLQHVATLAPDQ